jgi:cysteine synthase
VAVAVGSGVLPLVTDDDAFAAMRRLAREEGLMAGISSRAAVHAALEIAARADAAGATVVVLLPDTAARYVSSALFSA